MRRLAPLATLLGSALAAFACAHGGEADIAVLASNSDQLIWEEGQKAFAKKNWESARQHFKRIVDGFPQSSLQPAARLALADSHYQEGGAANYILAVSAYREFLTLYPSHPRSDYAQFQVGECFFRQRNGPDRDQTPTLHALEEFQRLLEIYPSSGQMETARERIAVCRQSLARAEFLAGYFYQRTRQACRAAIGRYEGILSDYPDYSRLDEVLYRLAQCLAAAGREAEARPHLGRLVEGYPQSEWADEARELMDRLSQAPAAPAPAVAPVTPASPSPDTTP
ncbi:MAG: outer membrane protein assembly factor BamD [Acidobacteria bacterium]|nr:outer membrane protein assembly factor BamD [Acidobacteriota bacterium]